MKKLLLIYFLPLVLALALVVFAARNKSLNTLLFTGEANADTPTKPMHFIPSFHGDDSAARLFLAGASESKKALYIIGSSELQAETAAIPYSFIPAYCNVPVYAYGHAGNQCLSVLCQLMANENKIKDTRIIFILSPGWFEGKPSRGTSSAVLLEYNPPSFLHTIAARNDMFSHYVSKRIAEMYSEFNAPCLPLRSLNFKYRASLSPLHYAVFKPLVLLDDCLSGISGMQGVETDEEADINASVAGITQVINWDSLVQTSRSEVTGAVTNNTMGINDSYYDTHIKGRKGRMKPVPEKHNKELADFVMLMHYLRTGGVDAYFVIQPLNPYYYTNLGDMGPVMERIRAEIKGKPGEVPYACADFFVSDTTAYDKALLTDIMHFSDYGWYKVNQHIISHYRLIHEE